MKGPLAFDELVVTAHTLPDIRGLRLAILFGPCARDEVRPGTDIAILADGGGSFGVLSVRDFSGDLRKIAEKCVDVVEVSEFEGTSFYERVIKGAVSL